MALFIRSEWEGGRKRTTRQWPDACRGRAGVDVAANHRRSRLRGILASVGAREKRDSLEGKKRAQGGHKAGGCMCGTRCFLAFRRFGFGGGGGRGGGTKKRFLKFARACVDVWPCEQRGRSLCQARRTSRPSTPNAADPAAAARPKPLAEEKRVGMGGGRRARSKRGKEKAERVRGRKGEHFFYRQVGTLRAIEGKGTLALKIWAAAASAASASRRRPHTRARPAWGGRPPRRPSRPPPRPGRSAAGGARWPPPPRASNGGG